MLLRAMTVGLLCVALGCSAIAEEKPIAKFKGYGQKKTNAFTVPNNWVVNWSAEGKILYFHVVDAETKKNKEVVARGANGLFPKGKKHFEQGGKYFISVNASGPWTLTIEEHRFED